MQPTNSGQSDSKECRFKFIRSTWAIISYTGVALSTLWAALALYFGFQVGKLRIKLAGDLPFGELKRKAYINPAARAADQDPQFSVRIGDGRPGFAVASGERI